MLDRIRQLTALGIFGVLFCALLFGLGPSLSARLVLIGEKIWEGYAQDLRYDAEVPECDLQELEAKLESCPITDGPSGVDTDDDEIDPSRMKGSFCEQEADPFADEDQDAVKVEKKKTHLRMKRILCRARPFCRCERSVNITNEETDPFAGVTMTQIHSVMKRQTHLLQAIVSQSELRGTWNIGRTLLDASCCLCRCTISVDPRCENLPKH